MTIHGGSEDKEEHLSFLSSESETIISLKEIKLGSYESFTVLSPRAAVNSCIMENYIIA